MSFLAPVPARQYDRLNESQFRRRLEGLSLAGAAAPRHRDPWAWWRARSKTYTDTAATVATSSTGPSGINPVRGWKDTISDFKLFLEFNPTSGEPRHHTPTDQTGIAGSHSVEYFDGGNKHACTDAALLALVDGVRAPLVLIVVVDMNAGGAATQTVAAFRDTEAAAGDESLLAFRRTGGLWATARRFENGAIQTVSAGTADNNPHVRTEILYRDDSGLLRCTRRLDGVEIADVALDDAGAGDFVWTRLIVGNSDYRAAATGTLHGHVAELLIAPYENDDEEVFDWEYYEGLFIDIYQT